MKQLTGWAHSTRFITDDIDYLYGLVFAGCCAACVVICFFFLMESKGRTLEEIDTMYVTRVNPITSASWKPPAKPPAYSTASNGARDANGNQEPNGHEDSNGYQA